MAEPLSAEALDQLFLTARTRNAWADTPVPDALTRQLYDTLKMGPTSANCSPARFVFVKTPAGKARLLPLMSEGNRKKTETAPLVVIVAHDLDFAEKLPQLFPHAPDAKNWFANPAVRDATAFRNGTLQGAYLILAARALGLDCGPMSGFDQAGVDREFFAGTNIKSNFVVNIGYGTDENLFPRSPRLPFEEAVTVV